MRKLLLVLPLFSYLLPAAAAIKPEPMLDFTAMDPSADPCVDFERYACGGWEDRTTLPGDKSRWMRSFDSINENNLNINKQILEDFAAGKNLSLASNSKKLGDFYGSCTDTAAIAANVPAFLKTLFDRTDALTSESLGTDVGYLHAIGVSGLFGFGPTQDAVDSAKMIASLDQGGMGLPSKDYYVDTNKATIREQYVAHIANMFVLAGTHEKQAQDYAKFILDFETKLAQHALLPVEQRDPQKLYNIKTIAELKKLAPNFNWDGYFKSIQAPKFSSTNVSEPDFFVNLSTLLQETPIEQLRIYFKWKILSAYAKDMSGSFEQEKFNFSGKILLGQKEITPRWKYCVNAADSSMADALGEAFVAKTFGPESKTKALEILGTIQSTHAKNLASIVWMDAATQQYSVEKLNSFLKKIGYPEKWQDLSSLSTNRNYLDNILACARYNTQWSLDTIGKPVDRSTWQMTPATVNAYYNPSNNEIVFPAGILQAPFFNVSAPAAANYGAMGAVIGHEMSHGFDDEGRQYDLNGNLRDWWSAGIADIFNNKAKCLVDQYSKYTVADGVHLNGNLTLGENIADLGGVKMSLAAFDSTLPSVLDTDAKTAERKKFFIAFGQIWCGKITPETAKLRAATDPHSPGKYRINGVVSNIPEFAQTFNCKAGAPLAPTSRCEIW